MKSVFIVLKTSSLEVRGPFVRSDESDYLNGDQALTEPQIIGFDFDLNENEELGSIDVSISGQKLISYDELTGEVTCEIQLCKPHLTLHLFAVSSFLNEQNARFGLTPSNKGYLSLSSPLPDLSEDLGASWSVTVVTNRGEETSDAFIKWFGEIECT